MRESAQAETAESHAATMRQAMVEEQIRRRGISAPKVLEAMLRVPRHEFVPEENRGAAYTDQPLPIGAGQTISQPYMVAFMTDALCLTGGERVLEVGAGSGYQAAVLSLLAQEVHSVELHPGHSQAASLLLARLGFHNVTVHTGDGSRGLPEFAPFDGILVTAAAPDVPAPLVEQLVPGGRLVIPVGGEREQILIRLRRLADGSMQRESLLYCRFVPLRGEFGWSIPEWMQP